MENSAFEKPYSYPPLVRYYAKQAGAGLTAQEQRALQQVRPPRFPTVLVIGCGAGREAFALERQGYEITAIDESAAMIASAQAFARGFSSRVCFLHRSLETLDFGQEQEERRFHIVLISLGLTGHFLERSERTGFLQSAVRFLHPEGVLIYTADVAHSRQPSGRLQRRDFGGSVTLPWAFPFYLYPSWSEVDSEVKAAQLQTVERIEDTLLCRRC